MAVHSAEGLHAILKLAGVTISPLTSDLCRMHNPFLNVLHNYTVHSRLSFPHFPKYTKKLYTVATTFLQLTVIGTVAFV